MKSIISLGSNLVLLIFLSTGCASLDQYGSWLNYQDGLGLAEENYLEDAEASYLKAIEQNSSISGARVSLGRLYLKQGERQKGIDYLNQEINLFPKTQTYINALFGDQKPLLNSERKTQLQTNLKSVLVLPPQFDKEVDELASWRIQRVLAGEIGNKGYLIYAPDCANEVLRKNGFSGNEKPNGEFISKMKNLFDVDIVVFTMVQDYGIKKTTLRSDFVFNFHVDMIRADNGGSVFKNYFEYKKMIDAGFFAHQVDEVENYKWHTLFAIQKMIKDLS